MIKISDGETEILREVVHEMLREIIDEPSYPAQVMKLVGEKRMGWLVCSLQRYIFLGIFHIRSLVHQF